MTDAKTPAHYDLLIIGGGVNGAGIARDAAGRGYATCLCEMGDFASATSSASTKLFHGGLRYLEYLELRLVREALQEREVLLRNMPHISWPMRFVLPYDPEMRFDSTTPVSRALSFVMPWMKGRRPAWLVRMGLFLYDTLDRTRTLPGTRRLDLTRDPAGAPLKPHLKTAFEYSDGWVDDARLVIANLIDAQDRGARICARTRVESATRTDTGWQVTLTTPEGREEVTATQIVNAAGPWVDQVLRDVFGQNDAHNIRLVRGSHIVVPRKFDHDRAYFFQNSDGRIIFAIPYLEDFTLIGTTDEDHPDPAEPPRISDGEIAYLCDMASQYFAAPVTPEDVCWTYSGVRPLYDDNASAAAAATRDYVIRRDVDGALLNIFGGKLTTYRRLSESALSAVESHQGTKGPAWTRDAAMPGGDFARADRAQLLESYVARYPFIPEKVLDRMLSCYGTRVPMVLGDARSAADLGRDFGTGLSEAEVRYLTTQEWAHTAEDLLYRRTKLGLRMSPEQVAALSEHLATNT
ncbi:glycerol-3-phosphate dehydrogenase [Pseudooceanicola nitratireducens]|uniref:glycerol-3-phosphate dehydrogenase n=1 Tax=Pseudooceanicola nitratireducens TaxID=517719 RepID=UPI0031071A6F